MSKKNDGKTEFFIMPGVEWVNGEKIKNRKSIRLTEREAQFELGSGKILRKKPTTDKQKPAGAEPQVKETVVGE